MYSPAQHPRSGCLCRSSTSRGLSSHGYATFRLTSKSAICTQHAEKRKLTSFPALEVKRAMQDIVDAHICRLDHHGNLLIRLHVCNDDNMWRLTSPCTSRTARHKVQHVQQRQESDNQNAIIIHCLPCAFRTSRTAAATTLSPGLRCPAGNPHIPSWKPVFSRRLSRTCSAANEQCTRS